MKGGSKIDGSHLEPIADRDYMARGEHERMKNYLWEIKNIQKPRKTSFIRIISFYRRYNCKPLFA